MMRIPFVLPCPIARPRWNIILTAAAQRLLHYIAERR